MTLVCDIRMGNANNLIEVNGKLFIEGLEHTPTNLAPVAFSQGPTAWGGAAGAPYNASYFIGAQGCTQLCLPRVYSRGETGVLPLTLASNFDSARIACGQDVEVGFTYSPSQNKYFGVAGYNGNESISSFDSTFRVITPNIANFATLSTFGKSGAPHTNPGIIFLPLQSGKWIVVDHSSYSARMAAGAGQYGFTVGALAETGIGSSLFTSTGKMAGLPYIGSDWVVVVAVPWTSSGSLSDASHSTSVYLVNRSTGAFTTLNLTFLKVLASASPYTLAGLSLLACYPSNAIIETPGSQVYWYQPSMTDAFLSMFVATLSNMSGTPALSAGQVYGTYTVNITTDVITVATDVTGGLTSADFPNLTRVRFYSPTGVYPGNISAATDYWVIKQSANTYKLALSYANAVAGSAIDITTVGNGSPPHQIFLPDNGTITIDTSNLTAGDYPTLTTSRHVRTWVIEDSGNKYLCLSVYEPGTSATVPTTMTNLYTWQLTNKNTAVLLPTPANSKLTLGDAGRVRTIIPTDSSHKRIVVVYDDKIAFYQWSTGTSSWAYQSTQSVQTQDVGVDSQGRVWATDSVGSYVPGTPTGTLRQSLYVFEPAGSAARITCEFSQGSYSYTGSNISSNVIVNAYDTSGARVALSIILTRDTTNFEFIGGASSVTVTTSVVGNTLVPITVTSTGLLSVLAVPTV